MRTLLLVVATLPLALAPAPAGAAHCEGSAGPSIGIFEVGGGPLGGTYYIVEQRGEWGPFPIRVYEESNGVYSAGGSVHDNLQRDMNGSPYLPDDAPHCPSGPWDPDTLHL